MGLVCQDCSNPHRKEVLLPWKAFTMCPRPKILQKRHGVNFRYPRSLLASSARWMFTFIHIVLFCCFLQPFFITNSPSPAILTDISWWRAQLSSEFCGSLISKPLPVSSVEFWVNVSSSWGIGIIFDNIWDAWKLKPRWNQDSCNIGWAEIVAIKLGILFTVHLGHSDTYFLIKSDNQGVIHVIEHGKSRNAEQNQVLQRITSLLSQHNLWISSLYVISINNLADPPSCGLPALGCSQANTTFSLPNFPFWYIASYHISNSTFFSHNIMRSLIMSSTGPFFTMSWVFPDLPLYPLPTSNPSPQPCTTLTRPAMANSPTNHCSSAPLTTAQTSFFNIDNCSCYLPPQILSQINQAIQNSWSKSTVYRYSGAIHQFIAFCDSLHIPQHLHFPASKLVLCAFTASSTGKHTDSTPHTHLSALKAWHMAHNLEWKGSTWLHQLLNSIHNLAPITSRHTPQPPATALMLSQLVSSLNLNLPFDAAVAACTCTAFWGQCHLGELLSNFSSTSSSMPFPLCSGFKRSIQSPQYCILHLPHTKTHSHGEKIILIDQNDSVNPILLIKNHICVNAIPKDGLLFSFRESGTLTVLDKISFLQCWNDIWLPFGHPRFTEHSFHIGGTTKLLIAGIPPESPANGPQNSSCGTGNPLKT